MRDIKTWLNRTLKTAAVTLKPLRGGDINQVYQVITEKGHYVLKTHRASVCPDLFEAEAKGLALLASTKTIKIPKVLAVDKLNGNSLLLMEYILPGRPQSGFWDRFGIALAQLHKQTAPVFGLDHDNYIGSLPQKNGRAVTAVSFYVEQRLLPQFSTAEKSGYAFPEKNTFLRELEHIIPNEKPALIHGDLWSGNYLVTKHNTPCLIDPAVSFASREMDIGMMHLFGGFDSRLFEAYEDEFPMELAWKHRIPVWQLYYLLVHLNLFGSGYYQAVKNILKTYT